MAKGLELEQQCAVLRERVVAADERAATAEAGLREHKAEAEKASRAATLQLQTMQRELEDLKANSGEAVRQAEMGAKLAQRRCAAEQELHKCVVVGPDVLPVVVICACMCACLDAPFQASVGGRGSSPALHPICVRARAHTHNQSLLHMARQDDMRPH